MRSFRLGSVLRIFPAYGTPQFPDDGTSLEQIVPVRRLIQATGQVGPGRMGDEMGSTFNRAHARGPEIWFRIVHSAAPSENCALLAAYRDQDVEVAFGPIEGSSKIATSAP